MLNSIEVLLNFRFIRSVATKKLATLLKKIKNKECAAKTANRKQFLVPALKKNDDVTVLMSLADELKNKQRATQLY